MKKNTKGENKKGNAGWNAFMDFNAEIAAARRGK